jgi:hypothetical protein
MRRYYRLAMLAVNKQKLDVGENYRIRSSLGEMVRRLKLRRLSTLRDIRS